MENDVIFENIFGKFGNTKGEKSPIERLPTLKGRVSWYEQNEIIRSIYEKKERYLNEFKFVCNIIQERRVNLRRLWSDWWHWENARKLSCQLCCEGGNFLFDSASANFWAPRRLWFSHSEFDRSWCSHPNIRLWKSTWFYRSAHQHWRLSFRSISIRATPIQSFELKDGSSWRWLILSSDHSSRHREWCVAWWTTLEFRYPWILDDRWESRWWMECCWDWRWMLENGIYFI